MVTREGSLEMGYDRRRVNETGKGGGGEVSGGGLTLECVLRDPWCLKKEERKKKKNPATVRK